MELLPLQTGLLEKDDDIVSRITDTVTLKDNDIVCISAKAIAITEGELIDLNTLDVSDEAKAWGETHNRDPRFRQAVLNELQRLNGTFLAPTTKYMRSELKPDGMKTGTILSACAGVDKSNSPADTAIGWPKNPVASIAKIRTQLEEAAGCTLGMILSDSTLIPRRLGVIAQALVVSGFDPITSQIGKPDLHGQPLKVTNEAHAYQLSTAANFLMGSADQDLFRGLL